MTFNGLEVPDDFINSVLESNGLLEKEDKETINEAKADDDKEKASEETAEASSEAETETSEQAEESGESSDSEEAVEENLTPEEFEKFLSETYGIDIKGEEGLSSIVEFVEDFSKVFAERLDEAGEAGEEEIDVDLDIVLEILKEEYKLDVDDVDVVASLVELAYDYTQV